MAIPVTETVDDHYRGLDLWPSDRVLSAIVAAQMQAVKSIDAAVPVLARAGDAAAARLRQGGRLIYAGAGSSGLLAQVDALELPGTYGIAKSQVVVLLAGGEAALLDIPSGAEDDAAEADAAVAGLDVGARDTLVAVSASGRTPYSLAALVAARARGALTVGIANNPDTPLLLAADHAVLLASPPEVVAGSTRMNAGTAQKCALNMLSTLIGIRLGHVYDGMMVNLQVENDKLRGRAIRIVAEASGVDAGRAAAALDRAGNDVKLAIALEATGRAMPEARALLAAHDGDLRSLLATAGTSDPGRQPTA